MPGKDARLIRPIATIGLHASASTWIFNVVRELMVVTLGEDSVLAIYEEEMAKIPDELTLAGRCLILKSHGGGTELDAWLETVGARVLLSVRDPRDAAISMSRRFG